MIAALPAAAGSPHLPVLRDLLLIGGASVTMALLFQRLRLPVTVAFIVAGVMIGPGGLGLVRDTVLVSTLSELGVVLLLFTVGLEFSLTDLRRLGVRSLVAGVAQLVLTTAVVALGMLAVGQHPARAVFFGLLVSLSSTAVMLKLLADRIELGSPHGRLATGVLLVQDLAVIAFILAVPPLGRWLAGEPAMEVASAATLGRAVAVAIGVTLAFVLARRALPWLVGRSSRSGSRETFLLVVLLVALGSATLASWAGGSLAIGAFLAGLILAESDLRTSIQADLLPFRDALASVFFVAIGMGFDLRLLLAAPLVAIASTAGMVLVKALAALVALRLSGAPWRVSFAAALLLAQIGEFSFVLARAGEPFGLLGDAGVQAFSGGAVFSLLLAPFLAAAAPRWALALDLRIAEWRMRHGHAAPHPVEPSEEEAPRSALRSDHVVIGGFGLNGRNVARVLRAVRLPHVVVDLDPDLLHQAEAEGSPVLVGDIGNPLVQKQAGVARARVLVLALSDPVATRHACTVARQISRDAFVVVRTRLVAEIDELHAAGASQVIPEEFETSIEIFTSVLREYHLPGNVVQAQVQLLRQERYSILRGHRLPREVVDQLDVLLSASLTDTVLLLQESPAVGRTLAELGLDGVAGARVVAIVRGGRPVTEFDGGFTTRVGDTLVITGSHAQMERAFRELSPFP